jgi:prefoldin subunit 5
MQRDRAQAIRDRIMSTHNRQRRATIDALKAEIREIANRLSRVAARIEELDTVHAQEETTIRLPILPAKR